MQTSANVGPTTLRLGTRGSLLAVTQASQVAQTLFEKCGVKVNLHTIKTQGDQIVDKPLWQIDGKDFFTKELDQALLGGEVDFVVHSLKDLGSERPTGITLAAISQRLYPNDILLCHKDHAKKLCQRNWGQKPFVVGTSSPRRICNLKNGLADLLPFGRDLSVELKNLRGNINTRLEKLIRGEYDAIVLAMTGLERLCLDASARAKMATMLEQCQFMILPQSSFPTAAGQGALGIECRSDDLATMEKLKVLHHEITALCCHRERQIFRGYGGGCHLAVGIHVTPILDGHAVYQRGEYQGQEINVKHSTLKRAKSKGKNAFIGMNNNAPLDSNHLRDSFFEKSPLPNVVLPADWKKRHLLVSTHHAMQVLETVKSNTTEACIWAAGAKTHQRLAANGHWVQGNADSMGEELVASYAASKAMLTIMPEWNNQRWLVLGPKGGSSPLGDYLPCYQRQMKPIDSQIRAQLAACDAFYWTSFEQYSAYVQAIPEIVEKFHACGPGKTQRQFRQHQINIHIFISIEEFTQWLTQA